MSDMNRKFHYWLENGTLIYASFLPKGQKTPVKLWGRIMKFDMLEDGDISFVLYNEDTKQSEGIRLSTLDDFQAEEEPDVQYVTYYPGEGSQVVSSIHGSAPKTDAVVPAEPLPQEAVAAEARQNPESGKGTAGAPVTSGPAPEAAVRSGRADELRELALQLAEEDQILLLGMARRLASR
ncbi:MULTISPECIES: hypothetical protein [Paenibacillus]|uniref:hypothetical protein n=1 Tax=Paenibacillus TaxID=44249 RepID=UPI0022B8C760|nr:hypothetical protein [Paenibacillus caseinilyticus]MCZ8521998.1 hypothetical protein [Paenibacillus caseinilyticus]